MESHEFKARLAEIDKRMRALLADPVYQKRADANAERMTERERREREEARLAWLRRRGVPDALFPVISSPRETEPLAFVRGWLLHTTPFGLLGGSVGVGKTVALAWAVAQEPVSLFVVALDLVQISLFGEEWHDLVSPHLLAIDDLGAEPLDEGGWGESKFGNLLNARLNAGRRTLLATNLGPDDLWERYRDERVRDRIRGACEACAFEGPSLRHPQLEIVPPAPEDPDDPGDRPVLTSPRRGQRWMASSTAL